MRTYANGDSDHYSIMSGSLGNDAVNIIVIGSNHYATNSLDILRDIGVNMSPSIIDQTCSDWEPFGVSLNDPESISQVLHEMPIQEEPKEKVDEPWHNQFKKKKRRF